ncbi:uncharacterized protein LOC133518241 [Cydia pomonella]|uniref:uncharacterized protein LOC133518241 n=1 Tax=Cydia pomonella TaxID=82600 RepID=UPI002ADE5CC5|nr:uncharacterized protein LOC133518241 [Cydia pomonella]
MARWLLLALASALCADAGRPARYADYSAARMPQYDTLYDARADHRGPADDYRDRSDLAAPIDYNTYDQESNDKRNPKTLQDEDLYQIPNNNNLRKEPTTISIDDIDADYNFKSEEIIPKNQNSNKRPRNTNKIEANESDHLRSKNSRNVKNIHRRPQDDKDNEATLDHLEEEKDPGSDNEKNKFVRRDIRQKVRRKSWYPKSAVLRNSDYDDQGGSRQGKDAKKFDGPLYTDSELAQNAPNIVEPDDARLTERSRPPSYKVVGEDNDDSETPSSSRHKAPMPKSKKKNTEYVDYNDMSRIEKIKNLPARSTTARTGAGAPRRWSFQDGFRRRFYNTPPQEVEQYAEILTNAHPSDASAALTTANMTTPSPPTTGIDEPLAPLSKDVLANITAFVNMSKQLSIAEMSQLSIMKKAQRRDSVKDEMLKDKPPVLLQVTERLQTVVMVEPPPVTQEPWLRARDIAEDSPERIAKVKRFMRNKLVANARNISELMENWDDTVCDYVDIALLDESGAVWMHTHSSYIYLLSSIGCTLIAYSAFCLF